MVLQPAIVAILTLLVQTRAQFEIQPPDMSLLDGGGLRMAYPGEEGIELFAVHYNINEPLPGVEPGEHNYDITEPTGDEWVHENLELTLQSGDVLYYWIFIIHDGLGYELTDQSWDVVVMDTTTVSGTTVSDTTTSAETTVSGSTPTQEPTTSGPPPGPCATWSGVMRGPGGSAECPSSGGPDECPITPTYEEMQDSGTLWECPETNPDDPTAVPCDECGFDDVCTVGTGDNPLCEDMTALPEGCCCPGEGCEVQMRFNWILSACQGDTAGDGPGLGCGGYEDTPETQQYKDIGTQTVVNYVAAYQWSDSDSQWHIVEDSSFNTDGRYGSFDLIQPDGGLGDDAWMQPQPGGAAHWSWGYYPSDVEGVGPPGMLFVLSVERIWNMAWYMLNQVTLERGPDESLLYPKEDCSLSNENCWSEGNAGEIDFLETAWTVGASATDSYRRLFNAQWNQVGRSFPGTMGSTCNADAGWFSNTECTNNYFLGSDPSNPEPQPFIYAAVVDSVGTFIYRIPADREDLWPGLTHYTAACTLQNRPTQIPDNSGPPCLDNTPYCALFEGHCQADIWGGPAAFETQGGANQGCKVNGQQGWCGNWFRLLSDTNQWLWPEGGRKSVVQFQPPIPAVEMPWNYAMEAWKVDWQGNTVFNEGCCVEEQGNCPMV